MKIIAVCIAAFKDHDKWMKEVNSHLTGESHRVVFIPSAEKLVAVIMGDPPGDKK